MEREEDGVKKKKVKIHILHQQLQALAVILFPVRVFYFFPVVGDERKR